MTSHFTSLLILVTAEIRYQQAYIDCRRGPSVAFEIQVNLAGSAPIIINHVAIVRRPPGDRCRISPCKFRPGMTNRTRSCSRSSRRYLGCCHRHTPRQYSLCYSRIIACRYPSLAVFLLHKCNLLQPGIELSSHPHRRSCHHRIPHLAT